MSAPGSLRVALAAAALLAAACGSSQSTISTAPTDSTADKSMRVLGRDNDVRIEARVLAGEIRQAGLVSIAYEIENFRNEPILFAPLEPTVDYEQNTRTVTVGLGSEIPLEEALPRLVRILPGERKSFTAGARIALPAGTAARFGPRYLQVRFSYLDGAEALEPLIARGASATDAERDGIFRGWLDHIAAVVTNALPIRWGAGGDRPMVSAMDRAPVAVP